MRYTIEYLNQRIDGEQRSIVPMVSRDKQSALDGARALIKTGISVSKVEGPGFRMREAALGAYYQSRRISSKTRPSGRTR
jgi:hypothetical protein